MLLLTAEGEAVEDVRTVLLLVLDAAVVDARVVVLSAKENVFALTAETDKNVNPPFKPPSCPSISSPGVREA